MPAKSSAKTRLRVKEYQKELKYSSQPCPACGIARMGVTRRQVLGHLLCSPCWTRLPSFRYGKLRQRAKTEGLQCNIKFSDWYDLTKDGRCSYCPNPLPETGFGLDRKDHTQGYLLDNVQASCFTCNEARRTWYNYDEWLAVVALLKNMRGTDDIWAGYLGARQNRPPKPDKV